MTDQITLPRLNILQSSQAPEIAEPEARLATGIRRLNLNESPWPPSPLAQAAMTTALTEITRYPDHGCTALISRLSAKNNIHEDRITFGNGSSEILSHIAQVMIEPGDEAILPAPTFPACAAGINQAGGSIINVPVDQHGGNDVPAMLEKLSDKTRIFYLCTPNNPTGAAISANDLKRAATEVPKNCLLVVDEAYFEFSATVPGEGVLDILARRDAPWIVTRSFSKAYGLAGMRIGYAFTSTKELRNSFWSLRTGFNINRVALAGAAAALDDDEYLANTLETVIAERERLAEGLRALGFKPYESQANFLMARSIGPASQYVDALAAKNIMISSLPWPDEDGCLRIGIGQAEDTDAVLVALTEQVKA
ncbi:MAG: aminotransferase class I/II-fold pyridoxal phosphate-dependent enzyme [Alphaproteobacteria bacterium]|jgi:histidinol-phosphate aminotransferase|nr:aminotransferase class I/II-fold pyridoxal phosphate-dependent enzyme [Alphaproteobacteria bacterium]MBT4019359.1 aminotransferase class I/II-fold pyridoxal phosphate-dependent enzyme [Alphaproteobacteria bacterium]MBT4966675.1 aminotransferase class I/II-fold pyridoxal phosphate-dependent enzyme [Alphaproteobacteria bacterium]MBT5159539.1 aminotransferase class I/II-fold pyridoxal phosphate-dependent enzyme [Alphaproteobacteria bacterium]MBT5920152.1 aminotransferase class I/II-fold pyridox